MAPFKAPTDNRLTAPNTAPILLFYGQSGIGKSSILDAGLIPRLEQGFEVRYLRKRRSWTAKHAETSLPSRGRRVGDPGRLATEGRETPQTADRLPRSSGRTLHSSHCGQDQ
ncbi:MAG: hypothetical protein ACOVOJ_05070 [Pirellula sp.]